MNDITLLNKTKISWCDVMLCYSKEVLVVCSLSFNNHKPYVIVIPLSIQNNYYYNVCLAILYYRINTNPFLSWRRKAYNIGFSWDSKLQPTLHRHSDIRVMKCRNTLNVLNKLNIAGYNNIIKYYLIWYSIYVLKHVYALESRWSFGHKYINKKT